MFPLSYFWLVEAEQFSFPNIVLLVVVVYSFIYSLIKVIKLSPTGFNIPF